VWRRDKKLFRDGIAVNRFVLTHSHRRRSKTVAGNARRRGAISDVLHFRFLYVDIYMSIRLIEKPGRERGLAVID
jgi:hypothetical protein